jgi:hypothetical protein
VADSFPDVESLLRELEPRFHATAAQWRTVHPYDQNRAWFAGANPRTPAELVNLISSPWPDGEQYLEDCRKALGSSLDIQGVSRRRSLAWREDDGLELEPDRLFTGAAPWRATEYRQVRGARTVSIVANLSIPGSVSFREITWPTAAAIAIADRLEDAGIRAEIWGAVTSEDCFLAKPRDYFLAVRVKAADQPLDIPALLSIAAPWFFRCACLTLMHADHADTPSTYGHPAPYVDFRGRLPEADGSYPLTDPAPILLERCWSREAALANVKSAIEMVTTEVTA